MRLVCVKDDLILVCVCERGAEDDLQEATGRGPRVCVCICLCACVCVGARVRACVPSCVRALVCV